MTVQSTFFDRANKATRLGLARRGVFALGVLAALFIGYQSLVPSSSQPNIEHFDKIMHCIAYMGLAVLFCVSVSKAWRIRVGLLVIAYGGALELLQHFMNLGRSGSWLDMLANVTGAVIGIGFAYVWVNFWAMRRAA